MFIINDILMFLFVVVALPAVILKGKWHSGLIRRLGVFDRADKIKLRGQKNIWIHAVSVGEVLAIEPLLIQLAQQYADHRMVCTVSTQTGYALARAKFAKDHCVLFAPMDFSFTVCRYIKWIQPKLYIAAETELWPNLFHFLKKQNVPIAIVNGRISDRSFAGYQKAKNLMRMIVSVVDSFCMQTQQDADRIIQLGARQENVHVVGNMKFDHPKVAQKFSLSDLHIAGTHKVFIAGSTHPGEEEIILRVYRQAKLNVPNLTLILAPRHVERAQKVSDLILQEGFTLTRLSAIVRKETTDSTDVLLVDTIGDLRSLYDLATVIFIGKSLVGQGGQNMIEPAACAKPVIVGPQTNNFRDVVRLLKRVQGIVQVADETQLQTQLIALLNNDQSCKEIGQRAKAMIDLLQGATEKTVQQIRKIYP